MEHLFHLRGVGGYCGGGGSFAEWERELSPYNLAMN